MLIVRIVSVCALLSAAVAVNAEDKTPAPKPLPGAPDWLKTYKFPQQEFTFVRIKYDSNVPRRGYAGQWSTDYPEADLNISAQLAVETALKVDPKGKILKLTDENLAKFPFIYLVEPGRLLFSDEEVKALRKYLDGGGFLMVDDFWGEDEWQNFYREIKRVYPDREPVEIPLEHKIFHCAFDLKEKPQVVSIGAYMSGRRTERRDAPAAHFRGIFDNKGRMQVLICHNTDLADGWEEAGVDPKYFDEYCAKRAYPMGINAIFYALTQKK